MTEEKLTEEKNPQREKIKLMLIAGTIVATVIFALIFVGFAASIKTMKEEGMTDPRDAALNQAQPSQQ